MPPATQTVVYARESTENIPASRRVRDADPLLRYLNPDVNPFTVISAETTTKVATNAKFEWFEKDAESAWSQVNNGAGYAAGDTSIVVDHGNYFLPGDIVIVPRTQEHMRVTAVNVTTNTLTVVRSVGDTAAAALVDNDDLLIIGSAYAEGSAKGSPKSHVETNPFNYTQIFRTVLGITRTEKDSQNYTGDDLVRLKREKMFVHKRQIEYTALFGERAIDTANTDNPRRYTGGLFQFYTSNIKDAGGTLTEPELEDWIADLTTHTATGDSRVVFAGTKVISVMNQLAAGKVMLPNKSTTYGIAVRQWMTAHGTLNLVRHRLLENGTGGNGYAGWAVAVDPKQIVYRPFTNASTKLIENIQNPGDDAVEHEYLTECGWQLPNPETGGWLKNVTA